MGYGNYNLEDTRRQTPKAGAHLAAGQGGRPGGIAPTLVGPPVSLPFYVGAKPPLRINVLHWFKSV
jgi:hypothetical protein